MKVEGSSNDCVESRLLAAYAATEPLEALSPGDHEYPAIAADWGERKIPRRWVGPASAAAAVAAVAMGIATVSVGTDAGRLSAAISHLTTAVGAAGGGGLTPEQSNIQERLDEAAARIREISAQDEAFDAVVVDAVGDSVAIYRADAAPARLARLYAPAIPRGVAVRYEQALLTRSQVNHLSAKVVAQTSALRRAGIHIIAWGEEHAGGAYVIRYDAAAAAPSHEVLAEFEIFGTGTVRFQPDRIINLGPGSSP